MRVVLVVLSGDETTALEALASRYPGAETQTISRTELERRNLTSRLRLLRAYQPDVFAVATERMRWQRGQDLFRLFGVLAGAREVVMLDEYGEFEQEVRDRIVLRTPARLTRMLSASVGTLSAARRQLKLLEAEVQRGSLPIHPGSVSKKRNQEKLKVTYLRATPGPGTQAGGAATHIKGVTEALGALGTELRLITNDPIAGIDNDSMTIVDAEPVGGTRALFEIHNNNVFTRTAAPIIEADPPDFIYQRYARFGWSGVVASLRTKRPLFLEYNGSEVWVGRYWDRVGNLDLLARFERLNLAAAARIFVVSEVERINLERAGVPPRKVIVNPNGVDTAQFRPDIGGGRIRMELGVSDNETLVGFVGSFGPWHGVLVLADAIKRIAEHVPVKFLLIGSGSLHADVKQMLAREEQLGRVIFTGAVDHNEVPIRLDACDVLVSPHIPLEGGAEFFGSPTKIFEYLAMGKGIVASRLGQIGDVLDHEKTALLVEPGNAEDLARAIERLVGSPDLRTRLGAAAREVAVARHTWRQNAQKVIDAYFEWAATD